MKRKLLITTTLAIALIGGTAFTVRSTTSSQARYDDPEIQVQGHTRLDPSVVKAVETASGPVQAETTVETPVESANPAPAATAPVVAPEEQATEPVTPPAPVTVTRIVGSNVNGNARAGIDTFTCTYWFSDGTVVARETQYIPVPSSMPAAICPVWE